MRGRLVRPGEFAVRGQVRTPSPAGPRFVVCADHNGNAVDHPADEPCEVEREAADYDPPLLRFEP